MAARTGYMKTNSGRVPAVVINAYDDGVLDNDADDGDVTTVDVLLLGVDSGRRNGLTVAANEGAANVNEFYWTMA